MSPELRNSNTDWLSNDADFTVIDVNDMGRTIDNIGRSLKRLYGQKQNDLEGLLNQAMEKATNGKIVQEFSND